MWVAKITRELVHRLVTEAKDEDNMLAFQAHILDPIVHYALQRIYPYILVTSIVFFMTFVMAVAILFLVLRKAHSH
jgi:hypothetical protein